MTVPERTTVLKELQATAGIFGRRLSEDIATAYIRALDDLAADSLLRMLHRLARNADASTRFPTPAELRQRVGGPVQTPDAPLADVALDRVRQAVYGALALWEQREGDGSARPPFEAAWTAARRREGWGGTVVQREHLWQVWLAAGLPLTRDRLRAIPAAANRRCNAETFPRAVGAVLHAVGRRLPMREPGCDDDQED